MKAGRELDEKVICDVLGWELIERSESNTRFPFVAREGKDKLVLWMEDDALGRYFSPSANIADAFILVEKLRIAIIPQSETAPNEWKYLAKYYDKRPWENPDIEAFAETAPLAICHVALKACGVEV